MAENGSLLSPTDKSRNHISSIFSSPRLFTGFSSKSLTDTESVMSPTSILDTKPLAAIKTPFWSKGLTDTESVMNPTSILDTKPLAALKTPFWSDSQTNTPKPETKTKTNWNKLDSRGVVLGLVDALTDEKSDSKLSKPETRMVLFGSQLKIQIPSLPPSVMSPNADCPMSPGDFGIKTRNSQLGCFSPLLSPSATKKSTFSSLNSGLENAHSPRVFSGCLSAGEMELSEDYTRVITHGPNPRTIHIFDDCIIENCCGIVGFSTQTSKKDNGIVSDQMLSYPSESFLSFCYNCKKNLDQGKDIYMYRGEKAFCSSECRFKEIKSDEGIAKPDDIYET